MRMIQITQSRNIYDYRPILEGLVKEWGYVYYHAILYWCNVIENVDDGKMWEVWVIKVDNEVIGICGLFSHVPGYNRELWLGWFGFTENNRGKGYGRQALQWMESVAKSLGCSRLLSYVDKDMATMPFYIKNGYTMMCTVGEYLKEHPDTADNFEDVEDLV